MFYSSGLYRFPFPVSHLDQVPGGFANSQRIFHQGRYYDSNYSPTPSGGSRDLRQPKLYRFANLRTQSRWYLGLRGNESPDSKRKKAVWHPDPLPDNNQQAPVQNINKSTPCTNIQSVVRSTGFPQ